MSQLTSYKPGTPCWVELAAPDIDAAVAFYSGLLGWDVPEQPPEIAEATGGYRRATLDGADVAGMMPMMQEGQFPAWTTYVSVDDAAATAATVRDAGGTVMVEPMEVMDLGTMAVFSDPGGAVFGVWQPGTFAGAGLVNETGALSWNELNTRDAEGASSFYGSVFGWQFDEQEMGEGETYTSLMLGGQPVGGMLDLAARGIPEEIPAHWQVYFVVDDTDAAIEQAKESGGGVMMEPIDSQAGRIAILQDPGGAAFAVIALSDMAEENAP
jgi:predicted enzyme related to lactoylglutathione lyase